MTDSSAFLSDCQPHRKADNCILHSLSNAPTLDVGADAVCTGCDLSLNELEKSVAAALNTPSGESEKECVQLVERMSSYFDTQRQATPPSRRPVRQVGPYEIGEQIGRGSMGTVYRGRHNLLQRDFAVKVLDARGTVGSKTVKRFQREIRSLGRVRHPNIVQATDAGEDNGVHYIAMEFLDGCDLGRLTRKTTLTVPVACELIRQAALGVHHAHVHGLIHRDIKPSNLMLCRDNDEIVVKVLDLGLARVEEAFGSEDEEDLTPAGIILGTFGYMSPEQLDDPSNTTPSTDLYSLGVVLWKLLTGQSMVTLDSGLLSKFPDQLQVLLTSAVATDPTDRPTSAALLAESLKPFASADGLPDLLSQ